MIGTDSEEGRQEAASIVSAGGVIAFRTDTFYGLGADPLNEPAVRRIRELKGREESKPILILIADVSELERFVVEPSGLFEMVAKRYWPAPLTLIGPARDEVPLELTAGTNTLGVRLPDDENVRSLLRVCGGALTATSANPAGSEPARTAQEVRDYFPRGIDLIIDGGEVTVTQPSTLVDLTGDRPRVIREGVVSFFPFDFA